MAKKQTKTSQKTQQSFAYDDLFIQLGLADLSEKEKERMAKQMQENIEGRIMVRILSSLAEEDKKAFDACKTDAEIEGLFKTLKIDPAVIAIEEALSFREELIKDASYIEGRLSGMNK